MSDRLWSPQMRKWARDSDRHGIPIGFYKARRGPTPNRNDWAGGGNPFAERFTDDEGLRIIDSPAGKFGNQPRTIDSPTNATTVNSGLPIFLVDDNGTTQLTDDSSTNSLIAP